MPLDVALFKELVEFLQSFFSDVSQRKTQIEFVFHGSPLTNQLNWQGSPHEFTVHLVKTLDHWGEVEPQVTALEKLLVALPGGLNQQTRIQVFVEQIRTAHRTWRWTESPFPGLQAFQERHEPVFFGREPETYRLTARIQQTPLVAVVGASGSGKSSLVQAGVLPRLKQAMSGQWQVIRFTPDEAGVNHPFASLRMALAQQWQTPNLPKPADWAADPNLLKTWLEQRLSAQQQVLLLVDQFEETFTTIAAEWRSPFVQALYRTLALPQVHLLLTMRSDFYEQCVNFPDLAERLETGTFPLSIPRPWALHQMIARPAIAAGIVFEAELIEQILADIGDEPGNLALLAYALDELYKIADVRHDRRITFADYEALEGVQGAIGKRAEQVFASLALPDKEGLLQRVFRELVEVDSDGKATRRRQALTHFTAAEQALITAFQTARLLVTDNGVVEVAHEALFRSWSKLAEWIQLEQDSLRLIRQFERDAKDWERRGKPADLQPKHEQLVHFERACEQLQLGHAQFSGLLREYTEAEATRLLREIEDITTSHKRRFDIGDRLSVIGDPRPYLGVVQTEHGVGLPDILWLPVTPGGEIQINDKTFPVQPFYIAQYLITYPQYEAFVQAVDGYANRVWWQDFPKEYRPQKLSTPPSQQKNYPRSTVSWYQSVAFSRWLDAKYRAIGLFAQFPVGTPNGVSAPDGRAVARPYATLALNPDEWQIRLPTEWEWQWAAQNGVEARAYPWGAWDEYPRANTTEAGINDRSTAVGMYPHGAANCGAQDMAGNLREWCLNDYGDPTIVDGFSNTNNKVLRGGAFLYSRSLAACAFRYLNFPYLDDYYVGCRLVVAPLLPSLSSAISDL